MKFSYEKQTPRLPPSEQFHLTIYFYHYQDSYNDYEDIILRTTDEEILKQLILKLKDFEGSEEEYFSFDYINKLGKEDYLEFACPTDYYCDGRWYCKAKLEKIIYFDKDSNQYLVKILKDKK